MRRVNALWGNVRPSESHRHIYGEKPSEIVDGYNKIFTLSRVPKAGSVRAYIGPGRWDTGDDYTVAGNTVTFTEAPLENDVVKFDYDY